MIQSHDQTLSILMVTFMIVHVLALKLISRLWKYLPYPIKQLSVRSKIPFISLNSWLLIMAAGCMLGLNTACYNKMINLKWQKVKRNAKEGMLAIKKNWVLLEHTLNKLKRVVIITLGTLSPTQDLTNDASLENKAKYLIKNPSNITLSWPRQAKLTAHKPE